MKEKFNQTKYIQEYNKENYKQFKADMKENERNALNKLIKENGYESHREFLLKCIEVLKEENNIFRKKDLK